MQLWRWRRRVRNRVRDLDRQGHRYPYLTAFAENVHDMPRGKVTMTKYWPTAVLIFAGCASILAVLLTLAAVMIIEPLWFTWLL
jgi:hypothetical protein